MRSAHPRTSAPSFHPVKQASNPARGGVYPRLDRLAEALTYVYPEFEFS